MFHLEVVPQLRHVIEALGAAGTGASVLPDVFVNPGNVAERLLLGLEPLVTDWTLEPSRHFLLAVNPRHMGVNMFLGCKLDLAMVAAERPQILMDSLDMVLELSFLPEGFWALTALELFHLVVNCPDVNLQLVLLLEVLATQLTLEPFAVGAMLVVHVSHQTCPTAESHFADLALEGLNAGMHCQDVGHQVGSASHLE